MNLPRLYLLVILSTIGLAISAQPKTYHDSMRSYHEKYVKKHEVVRGSDKSLVRFFAIDDSYRINARFERIFEAPWFRIETSGSEKKVYRVYGILHFTLKDTVLKLHVYQSQQLMEIKEYADHLFIPFTDLTCGEESYDNGRYIDLTIADVENGLFVLDFNKAYNPYCAYVTGRYNCPLPPPENDLAVAIRAGEMKFDKDH